MTKLFKNIPLSFAVLLFSLLHTAAIFAQSTDVDYTQYVNPFIGTGGHGHNYPGATMPFGMVQLSPDTGNDGWDWCSGYNYGDTSIAGFSHTHLSGTGIGDLGDILLMPGTGQLLTEEGSKTQTGTGYRSSFSHRDEVAKPGYYKVLLRDYGIKAELTATEHAGFHRYTFPSAPNPHVLLNLDHGLGNDKTLDAQITVVDKYTIKGYRRSSGWAKNQIVYFTMIFNKPFRKYLLYSRNKVQGKSETVNSTTAKAELVFRFRRAEELLIKVGISAVDGQGADNNLSAEIQDWDFDLVARRASQAWQSELSKIRVEGKTDSLKTIFYTSLYHAMLAPTLYSDVDGRYRGGDQQVHTGNFKNYTTFSIWDTFRAENPLLDLIEPERVGDFMHSFLAFEQESGYLPVWPLMGNETYCMTGYHAIPIIADAYFKGLVPEDIVQPLYNAMIKSANQDRSGIKLFNEMGFIPYDKCDESVSRTLDYAIDDWCIARMAGALQKTEDQKLYMKRFMAYKNVFYAAKGFVWGKDSKANWKPGFDPFNADGGSDGGLFTEGNSWQYTFLMPEDVSGLSALLGGRKKLELKLDQLFAAPSKLTGKSVPPDVDGLIGQYAHGNEPGHHIPYLYDFTDNPSKTQERIRMILQTQYRNKPNGLAGNEDCGQMSAWYVMSAMGIYQVNPADGNFYFGSPLFDKVEIYKHDRLVFRITALNNSENAKYIASASMKGSNLQNNFVNQAALTGGIELTFRMTDKHVIKQDAQVTPVRKAGKHANKLKKRPVS